jgi:hypothetical protein
MFQFPGLDRVSRDQRSFDSFPRLIAAFHAHSLGTKTSPTRPYELDHNDSCLATQDKNPMIRFLIPQSFLHNLAGNVVNRETA